MAIITTINNTTWTAEFNRSQWRIVNDGNKTTIHAMLDGKMRPITARTGETVGLLNLLAWHKASERQVSELPTLYAAIDGGRSDD